MVAENIMLNHVSGPFLFLCPPGHHPPDTGLNAIASSPAHPPGGTHLGQGWHAGSKGIRKRRCRGNSGHCRGGSLGAENMVWAGHQASWR